VSTVATIQLAHRFGVQPDYSLGVEEELLLVDRSGNELRPDADRVIASASPRRGRLTSEIFAAQVELVTPVCRTISDAAESLAELNAAVRRSGASVIGAGLHPAAKDDAELCSSPRYREVSAALQGLLRTPPAALHVHVGMPDPETAIRASNGLRRHLPLLHSLAANSPFWYGRDSGLASARAAILRSYPRYGVPRWFRDWEDFSLVAHDLARAAGVPDYTYFWWDVRPHPRLGTVEVRAADTQFSAARTVALSALIHALARREAEARPPRYRSRDEISEACYQATRYGLDALLPDDAGRRRPARDLALDAVCAARPYARELGCADALEGINQILIEGNGADLQRSIYARGGMPELLRWLMRQRSNEPMGLAAEPRR
jgi:glutamate---cysteine ligase / carboxylate-amine ligase